MHHLMRYCSRLTLIFLLLATPATCYSWSAKVVSIANGDTIAVLRNNQQKEIRPYGIECPEKVRSHSEQAKTLALALVAGRNVDIEQKDRDQSW